MHQIAEYGVTALKDAVHWRYKESKAYKKAKTPRENRSKDRSKQLAELRKILNGEQETVISMVKDLLEDRIYVITPDGHVISLPAGATPLDFAYRIHTDLGNRYIGAKVGGHMVRLDYEVKNGEIVELITSRARKGPSREWLSTSKDDNGKRYYVYARTPQARSKIRHWFRSHAEVQKTKV
jgi:guanosine-3',5'-bis(diphosphate) 3'-pyrophosphohydrolase